MSKQKDPHAIWKCTRDCVRAGRFDLVRTWQRQQIKQNINAELREQMAVAS